METDRHTPTPANQPPAKSPSTTVAMVVLFVLAPLIGEISGAALRFSHFAQPPRVLAILCFYGAGVVLIREISQRLRLNVWGISLLGVAYALLEEGIGLQTIFNPQGMDGEPVWGRAFEVNWLWAIVVIGYHVVWSVLIPISLTHLSFPDQKEKPWLSRSMLVVFAVIFALGLGTFVFISLVRSDFRLSAVHIGASLALVAALGWAATRCRKPTRASTINRPIKPATVGWFSFGSGLVWLVLYLVALIGTPVSFLWWTLAALLFASFTALVLYRWSTRICWGTRHQLAVGFGAVIAVWIFGLFLVANGGRADDVAFHVVVLIAVLLGFRSLRRRTRGAVIPL